MTSIVFLIETIYRNIFRCNYLRNKTRFLNFLLKSIFKTDFRNQSSTLKIFKKEMTLIGDVFSNLLTSENVVRKMSKNSRFRVTFDK